MSVHTLSALEQAIGSAKALKSFQDATETVKAFGGVVVDNNRDVVIPLVKLGGQVTLHHEVKADQTEVVHYDRELPRQSNEDAFATLMAVGNIHRSVEACCASLIADRLISDSRTGAAIGDKKQWAEIKKDCEKDLESRGLILSRLPQQWANYWTQCHKALVLGFPLMGLFYVGAEERECVTSRSQLMAFVKAQNVEKTPKEERAAKSLESLAVMLDGGEDGTGEIISGADIHVSERTAVVLAEIALNSLSTESLREVVAQVMNLEDTIAELVRLHGADAIISLVNDSVMATGTNG